VRGLPQTHRGRASLAVTPGPGVIPRCSCVIRHRRVETPRNRVAVAGDSRVDSETGSWRTPPSIRPQLETFHLSIGSRAEGNYFDHHRCGGSK
jgi:hypothetical protein